MSMFSKVSGKKKAPPAAAPSPLSGKKRALQEQEAKVQADMERCKKLVEDAPRIAEEQRRRQREEMLIRSSMTHRPTRLTTIQDRGTTLRTVNPEATHDRGLRKQRQQGRLMFFVLLLTLAAAIFYLYHTVTHG